MCSRIVFVLVVTLVALRPAVAGTVCGELTTQSTSFEGYRYAVFLFDSPQSDPWIAMHSAAFDRHLLLVVPDGRVLTNDDHSLSVNKLRWMPGSCFQKT